MGPLVAMSWIFVMWMADSIHAEGDITDTEEYCEAVDDDGGNVGTCVFPFTVDGLVFDGCTNHSLTNGKYWCSTLVDNYRNHKQGNWGYCPEAESCPRDDDPKKSTRAECRLSGWAFSGRKPDATIPARKGTGAGVEKSDLMLNYCKKACREESAPYTTSFAGQPQCDDCTSLTCYCYTGNTVPDIAYNARANSHYWGPCNDKCRTIKGGGKVNAKCVLPFEYNGLIYKGCTSDSSVDGKVWCSTSIDTSGRHRNGTGNWGYCDTKQCFKDLAPRPVRRPEANNGLEITATKNKGHDRCVTKESDKCLFPFTYGSKTYNGCTKDQNGDGGYWCSTEVDENGNHGEDPNAKNNCNMDKCPKHSGNARDTMIEWIKIREDGLCDDKKPTNKELTERCSSICYEEDIGATYYTGWGREDTMVCESPRPYDVRCFCWRHPADDKKDKSNIEDTTVSGAVNVMTCEDAIVPNEPCKTQGGAVCQFPFEYEGKTYKGCTKDGDDDGKNWCSTQVDENGQHVDGNIGHCNMDKCPVDFGSCILHGKKGRADVAYECLHDSCGVTSDDVGIAPWHAVIEYNEGSISKTFVGILISPRHILTVHKLASHANYLTVSLNFVNDQATIEIGVTESEGSGSGFYILTLDEDVDLPYACLGVTTLADDTRLTLTYRQKKELREKWIRVGTASAPRFVLDDGLKTKKTASAWITDGGHVKIMGFRSGPNNYLRIDEGAVKKVLKKAYE